MKGDGDIQASEEQDANNGLLLPPMHIQTIDHGNRHHKNHNINQHRGDPIPEKETRHIDTRPHGRRIGIPRPEIGDGSTRDENGHADRHPVADDEEGADPQRNADLIPEDAAVEHEDGELGEGDAGGVDHHVGEEDLYVVSQPCQFSFPLLFRSHPLGGGRESTRNASRTCQTLTNSSAVSVHRCRPPPYPTITRQQIAVPCANSSPKIHM
jgi:hypothetical protein